MPGSVFDPSGASMWDLSLGVLIATVSSEKASSSGPVSIPRSRAWVAMAWSRYRLPTLVRSTPIISATSAKDMSSSSTSRAM